MGLKKFRFLAISTARAEPLRMLPHAGQGPFLPPTTKTHSPRNKCHPWIADVRMLKRRAYGKGWALRNLWCGCMDCNGCELFPPIIFKSNVKTSLTGIGISPLRKHDDRLTYHVVVVAAAPSPLLAVCVTLRPGHRKNPERHMEAKRCKFRTKPAIYFSEYCLQSSAIAAENHGKAACRTAPSSPRRWHLVITPSEIETVSEEIKRSASPESKCFVSMAAATGP